MHNLFNIKDEKRDDDTARLFNKICINNLTGSGKNLVANAFHKHLCVILATL